jgi:transcriptional regulator with XRE-family HTH domain
MAAEIGHAVRVFRQAKGLRIKQLAQLSGVSPGAVCYVEQGKQIPNVRTLVQLLQVLGLAVTLELRPRSREDAAVFEQSARDIPRRPVLEEGA